MKKRRHPPRKQTVKNTKNNDNLKLLPRGYRVEFDVIGRITTEVIFTPDSPRTISDVQKEANTKNKLLEYFESIGNRYQTPTKITVCIGGTANTNGKFMRRNSTLFETDGRGGWHVKDEIFVLINKQRDKDRDTPNVKNKAKFGLWGTSGGQKMAMSFKACP